MNEIEREYDKELMILKMNENGWCDPGLYNKDSDYDYDKVKAEFEQMVVQMEPEFEIDDEL